MKIELHSNFKKSYKKRIANNQTLVSQVAERLRLFQQNPQNPILHTHRLAGAKKDLRSFSVTGDIGIVYMLISKDKVIFLDIGSHNQVY